MIEFCLGCGGKTIYILIQHSYLGFALPVRFLMPWQIDAIHWILAQCNIDTLHYLEDFLIIGPIVKEECEVLLEQVYSLFTRLGIPIALHKTEGPARTIVFLPHTCTCSGVK